MSPEYGSTCAIFPIDDETLRYLRLTGRSREQVDLVEAGRYLIEHGVQRLGEFRDHVVRVLTVLPHY